MKELQEDLIGGQGYIPEVGRQKQERDERTFDQQVPQQDVEVDHGHVSELGEVEHPFPSEQGAIAECAPAQPETDGQSAEFGDQGCERNAAHAEIEPQHKDNVENDVDAVHHQLENQDGFRAFERDQPADDPEQADRRRRGVNPDADVVGCQRLDLRRNRRNQESGADNRNLDQYQEQPRGQSDREAPDQQDRDLRLVPLAPGLCGLAGRAQPKKAEKPVEGRDDDRADPDRADRGGLPKLPDHTSVNRAEYRNRRVGKDDRDGDPEDAPVADARGRCFGHSGTSGQRGRWWQMHRKGAGFWRTCGFAPVDMAAPPDIGGPVPGPGAQFGIGA